jgi:hypothetical protein
MKTAPHSTTAQEGGSAEGSAKERLGAQIRFTECFDRIGSRAPKKSAIGHRWNAKPNPPSERLSRTRFARRRRSP